MKLKPKLEVPCPDCGKYVSLVLIGARLGGTCRGCGKVIRTVSIEILDHQCQHDKVVDMASVHGRNEDGSADGYCTQCGKTILIVQPKEVK